MFSSEPDYISSRQRHAIAPHHRASPRRRGCTEGGLREGVTLLAGYIVGLAGNHPARSTPSAFLKLYCQHGVPAAVCFSHPVAGEGVWRQGQPRAAGCDRCGTSCVAFSAAGGGTGPSWRTGCSPLRRAKGLSSGLKRRSPGAWPLPPVRASFRKGLNGERSGAENRQTPAGHAMPAPKRSEAAITRSQGGDAENTSGPRNAKAGGHIPVPGRAARAPRPPRPFPAETPASASACAVFGNGNGFRASRRPEGRRLAAKAGTPFFRGARCMGLAGEDHRSRRIAQSTGSRLSPG